MIPPYSADYIHHLSAYQYSFTPTSSTKLHNLIYILYDSVQYMVNGVDQIVLLWYDVNRQGPDYKFVEYYELAGHIFKEKLSVLSVDDIFQRLYTYQ